LRTNLPELNSARRLVNQKSNNRFILNIYKTEEIMEYNNIISAEDRVTLEVTVDNLSPENGALIAPVWFGLHNGSFDTFEPNQTASSGVMYLAEEGITGLENTVPGVVEALIAMGLDVADVPPAENTLAGIFAASDAATNGGTQGVLDNPDSPLGIFPGNSFSTTIDIDSANLANNRFFNYAAMFFPSNDAFIANDRAIELFDAEGNFIGTDIVITGDRVWDAGTEVNDENPNNVPFTLDLIGNGIDENVTIQSHQGFQPAGSGGVLDANGGFFANADFTDSEDPIARISINPLINGTAESDLIFGSSNRERIVGFAGNDLIVGDYGNDTLEGGEGDDRLFGEQGDDYLLGNIGRDFIVGDVGNDLIDGGEGDDVLWGNLDADRFVVRAGNGLDTILDYENGVDTLVLADGLEYNNLTITQGVGEVVLQITDTGENLVSLAGITASDITIEDFASSIEL
jgi:Ca2+-binding RTX toxin-like protein